MIYSPRSTTIDRRLSTMLYMSIGERLRSLRVGAGLTQLEMADIVGTSKQYVSQLESGRNQIPNGQFLEGWSRHFGISLRWLSTGKGARDHADEASQSGRLDSEMVSAVAEAMRIVMARRGRQVDLTEQEQSELFVEAYAELAAMRDGTSSMAAGAVVADLQAAREARSRGDRERDLQAGGVPGKSAKS
jgi:transcriptional regulator with XRE-family HTH domain